METSDPYVQKNGVLKNKLNIKNEEKLKLAESDIVITRIHEYFSNMSFSKTKEFYLSLHKHLFGDIYPFAGEIRTVNIEKQERVLAWDSVKYVSYDKINDELDATFEILSHTDFLSLDIEMQKDFLTSLISDLWGIHAFREGNTRTVLVFLRGYLNSYGINFNINFFKNSNTYQYARDALVASYFESTILGITRNYTYLRKLIGDIIEEDLERKRNI